MKQFYVLEGLKVHIEMNKVLESMDCKEDNPAYEEFVKEYQEIYEQVLACMEPVGIIGFGQLTNPIASDKYPEGTQVALAVLSIGKLCEKYASDAFREGNYVRGMLCDSMADLALFSMEDRMLEQLKSACCEHQVGVLKRLEAPQDISMEVQKYAWDYLELHNRFGINISSGYMFDPIKTYCQVFVLTDDMSTFRAEHDCSQCANTACRHRQILGNPTL